MTRTAKDFIMRLGLENPYQRYDATLALTHPFITRSEETLEHLPPVFEPQTVRENALKLRRALLELLYAALTQTAELHQARRARRSSRWRRGL